MPIKQMVYSISFRADTQSFSSLASGLHGPHTDYILNGSKDQIGGSALRPSVTHPVISMRRVLLSVPARI